MNANTKTNSARTLPTTINGKSNVIRVTNGDGAPSGSKSAMTKLVFLESAPKR